MSTTPMITPQEAANKAEALIKEDRKWNLIAFEVIALLEIAVLDNTNGWAHIQLGIKYLQSAKEIAESQSEKEELWKKASIVYRKGAALGFSACADSLGNMLRTGGPGVPCDSKEALRLYEMAAANGVPNSAICAYKMLKKGEGGVPMDWNRALLLLKNTATMSRDIQLLTAIGRCYLDAPPPICNVAAARATMQDALSAVNEQKKILSDIDEITKNINILAQRADSAMAKRDMAVLKSDLKKLESKKTVYDTWYLEEIVAPKVHRAMGEALLRASDADGITKDVAGAAAEFEIAAENDKAAHIHLALMCLNGEKDEKQNRQRAAIMHLHHGFCSGYAKRLITAAGITDDGTDGLFKVLCGMSPAMRQLATSELPKMSADEHFAAYKKLSYTSSNYDGVMWPRHLKAAYDNGHAEAAATMGMIIKDGGRCTILDGNSTPADALKLLQEAHKRGSDIGTTLLAECLYEGYATEKDAAGAAMLLERPAKCGCTVAQILLGKIYLETLTWRWKDGFSYLKKAASNKDTRLVLRSRNAPLMMMAMFMERGVGDKKSDRKAAAAIYRKVIANKKTTFMDKEMALHKLGMIYLNGDGKTSSASKAFECFSELETATCSPGGKMELANMYFRGIGTTKSLPKATKILNSAMILSTTAIEAVNRFGFPERIAKEISNGKALVEYMSILLQDSHLSSFAAPSAGLPVYMALPDGEVASMAGVVYTKRSHRNVWSERWVALTVNGVLRFYNDILPKGKLVRTAVLKPPFNGCQLKKQIKAGGKQITPMKVIVDSGEFLFLSVPDKFNQLWMSVMSKVCTNMTL